MATETSNGSSSGSTTTASKFVFRPSALSDVADKMWKKTGADSASTANGSAQLKLFATPVSSTGNSANNLFTATSTTGPSHFIFGKNISNRVVIASSGDVEGNEASGDGFKTEEAPVQKDELDGNGVRVDVSFDSLAATSMTTTDAVASSNGATSTTSTTLPAIVEDTASKLEESAAALEAAKHQNQKPHLLAPEEVKTGEEDEINVAQATVKLYVFDPTKESWTDRGLAIMRVNDRNSVSGDGDVAETRIVVRLQGSLRVIVNTKLWPEMLLERVSPKRLRLSGTVEDSVFSANESEQIPPISIYLISGSQSDVERIERTLKDRLTRLKSQEQRDASILGKKRPVADSDTSSSSGVSDQDELSPAKKRAIEEQSN